MRLFLLLALGLVFTQVKAQDPSMNMETKKYYLIAASMKDYDAALKKAKSLSTSLDLELNLRDLKPQEDGSGLTWDQSTCEGDNWEYPCYVARGRYDDGDYISIEWSNAISGFSKGYYVVVISSQSEYGTHLKEVLTKVRTVVKDAYVKSAMVYMGCMH